MREVMEGKAVKLTGHSGPTTAMLKAIELWEFSEAVRFLEQGADPCVQAYTGQTALQRVLRQPPAQRTISPEDQALVDKNPGYLVLMGPLQSHSSLPGALSLPERVFKDADNQWWLLPNAVEAGSLVKAMIAAEVDVNATSEREPRTPLQMAINARQWRACEMLLRAGANPNVWSEAGQLPIMHATRLNAPVEVYRAFLEVGVDLEACGKRRDGSAGPSVAKLMARDVTLFPELRQALAEREAMPRFAAKAPSP
jgi:hypothetical protein